MRRLLALLAATGALATLPAAATSAEKPTLTIAGDSLVASPEGSWALQMVLHNPLASGFYLDSLLATTTDSDPGVTGEPRVQRRDLTRLASAFSPLSSGDSARVSMSLPAPFERGTLQLDWYGHDGSGARHRVQARIALAPDPTLAAVRSTVREVAGRSLEVIEWTAAAGSAPAPGVLLLHGAGAHARTLLRRAARLQAAGHAVVLVSEPGFGQSAGPAEALGAASRDAVAAGWEALRRLPGVDADRCVIWGEGRGAVQALAFAGRAPAGLAGVIAQSAELRGRAPEAIAAAVLLMQGRNEPGASITDARLWSEKLRAAGTRVDSLFTPGSVPPSRGAVDRTVDAFLASLTRR